MTGVPAPAVTGTYRGRPERILLLGARTDVGTTPGHGENQSFLPEDVDRPQDGVPAYAVFLLELFHGRQGTVAPLALGDPGPEDDGQLQVGRLRGPVINGHMIKLDHRRSDLFTWYICSALY